MFPINTNLPKYDAAILDTGFTTNTGTVAYGPKTGVTYTVAAVGQGLHGLNINSTIEVRPSLAGARTIVAGAQFVGTTSYATRKAWDGTQYINYTVNTPTSQIAGYRSGDFRIHRVPGLVSWARTTSAVDTANNLVWRNYATISGFENYVYGFAMGKNSFIYSKGVGESFKVTFINSTGSTTVTRKYIFRVERFGYFNTAYTAQTLTIDSGCVDRNGSVNAPNAACIITAGLPLTPDYQFRLHDVNEDGSKCLIALVAQQTDVLDRDNGIDSLDAFPFGWVEVTFTCASSVLAGSVAVKKHYSTNTGTPSAIALLRYNDGAPPGFDAGLLLRDTDPTNRRNMYIGSTCGATQVRFTAPPAATGSPPTVPPVIVWEGGTSPYKIKYNTSGVLLTPSSTAQGSFANNNGSADSLAIPCDIGQSIYVSGSGTETNIKRCIHLAYVNNVITEAYVHYESYSGVVDTTLEAECVGTIAWGVYNVDCGISWNGTSWSGQSGFKGPCIDATGSYTITYKKRRETYSRKFFGLIVNGTYIDQISTESAVGISETTYTKTVNPYVTGSSTAGTVYSVTVYSFAANNPPHVIITDTVVSTGLDTKAKDMPSRVDMNPFGSWSNSYQPLNQAGSIGERIRNLSVATAGDSKSWIKPFVRVESNTLISFNIGDSDYSVSSPVYYSGTFPITVNQLVTSGTHFRRTVAHMSGAIAAHNDTDSGHATNPASDIPATRHWCSYNTATTACILNSTVPCVYV